MSDRERERDQLLAEYLIDERDPRVQLQMLKHDVAELKRWKRDEDDRERRRQERAEDTGAQQIVQIKQGVSTWLQVAVNVVAVIVAAALGAYLAGHH